jgi:hypothetical protein
MSTNLKMKRGDTKLVQVTTTSTLTSSGLTGYKFWFTAKNAFTDADASAVIKKLTADFTVVQNGNATTPGIVTCKIDPADTASLPHFDSTLLYDVQFEDSDGNVTTVASGTLTVQVDVTKAS